MSRGGNGCDVLLILTFWFRKTTYRTNLRAQQMVTYKFDAKCFKSVFSLNRART